MKRRQFRWFVWLAEYSDEGSILVTARTAWEAKKKARPYLGDEESELVACRATQALIRARAKEES